MTTSIRIALIATVLIGAASFAFAAPGPERPLTERPLLGPAFGIQTPLAMAFHGDDGFVIWTDTRTGVFDSDNNRIARFGSRITAAGRLLDPEGIPLPNSAYNVVWGGDAWNVLLQEGVLRLDRNGRTLGNRVTTRPFTGTLATNGRTFAFVTPSGVLSDVSFATLDLGAAWSPHHSLYQPAPVDARRVVSDGSSYFVFGHAPGVVAPGAPATAAIVVAAVSETGEYGPIRDTGLIESRESKFDVVWSGRDFVALLPAFSGDWSAVRLTFDFVAGPKITLPPQSRITTAGNGSVVVTWIAERRVYAAPLLADTLGSPVLLQDFNESTLSRQTPFGVIAAASSHYVFAAQELRTTTIPSTVDAVEPVTLSTREEQTLTFPAQHQFATPLDPSSPLYVFTEQDGDTSRVMIGQHGSQARRIFESPARQYAPSIASNGRDALVTWIERRERGYELRVLPVRMDGSPRLPSPLVVGGALYDETGLWSNRDYHVWPAGVTWSGSAYFVVWTLDTGYAGLVRVLGDGTLLDREPRHLTTTEPLRGLTDHHVLVPFGPNVLWVWMQRDVLVDCGGPTCGDNRGVRALRLSSAGVAVDPLPLEVRDYAILPQAVVKDATATILFEAGRSPFMRRLSFSGTFLDASPVRVNRHAERPSITTHRNGFLLTWQSSLSVEAAFLNDDLQLGQRYVLATDAIPAKRPVAFTNDAGNATVAYVRVDASTAGVPRLYLRTFNVDARTRSVRR